MRTLLGENEVSNILMEAYCEAWVSAPVEGRVGAHGRRDRAGDPGLSLAIGQKPGGTRSSIGCSPPITSNWRVKPLTERATIVNLIASTRHEAAISWSLLDSRRAAPPPRSQSRDAQLEAVILQGHAFRRDWQIPESREYLSGAA